MRTLIYHPRHAECYSALLQLQSRCEFVNAYTKWWCFLKGLDYYEPIGLALLYMPRASVTLINGDLSLEGPPRNLQILLQLLRRRIPAVILHKGHGCEDFFECETAERLNASQVLARPCLWESYWGIDWRMVLEFGTALAGAHSDLPANISGDIHRGYPNP